MMRPSRPEVHASTADADSSTKASSRQTPGPPSSKNHPISFFMMSGDSLQQHQRANAAPAVLTTGASPRSGTAPRSRASSSADADSSTVNLKMPSPDTESSTYGVQSLQDVVSAADELDRPGHNAMADAHEQRPASSSSQGSSGPSGSPSRRRLPRPPSVNTISMPLTPVYAHSPHSLFFGNDGVSTPRSTTSLHSFRLEASDDESERDCTSQAVTSGSEEEEQAGAAQTDAGLDDSAPQLVMPSVTMPKRRAFTEKGKQLGRLKILVAGPKGSGKSSLIKSIVQTCEDIVHVDPVESTTPKLNESLNRNSTQAKSKTSSKPKGTSHITEIYASTKAYPHWWHEMEESKLLKRRKSFSDNVLERNICFVDTPGFDGTPATANSLHSIVNYVEALLHRSATFPSMSNDELLGLLAGSGGVQVDAVLFFLSPEPSTTELGLFRRLASMTNVIPILAKSDTLPKDDLMSSKRALLQHLQLANIQPFLFGHSIDELHSEPGAGVPPYAVSSWLSSDDTMDASLLMSPDYQPPLHPSDLTHLVSCIFEPSMSSWLRHSAANKFLAWRKTKGYMPPSMSLNTIHPAGVKQPATGTTDASSSAYTCSSVVASSLSPSAVLVSHGNTQVAAPPVPSYTLSRLADHTQREERLAQVRLARWASDLQRALRNERERFALLQDAERRRWLQERLGERVSPLALEDPSVEQGGGMLMRLSEVRNTRWRDIAPVDPRDPLGLLAWKDRVRWRVSNLATVVGGAGLAGAIMLWCMRYLEWQAALQHGLWNEADVTEARSIWARFFWG